MAHRLNSGIAIASSRLERDGGRKSHRRCVHIPSSSNPHDGRAESEEKREPVSDIDTGVADSLKVLDLDGRLEKRTFSPGGGSRCVNHTRRADQLLSQPLESCRIVLRHRRLLRPQLYAGHRRTLWLDGQSVRSQPLPQDGLMGSSSMNAAQWPERSEGHLLRAKRGAVKGMLPHRPAATKQLITFWIV
jgi:hypothetical protein